MRDVTKSLYIFSVDKTEEEKIHRLLFDIGLNPTIIDGFSEGKKERSFVLLGDHKLEHIVSDLCRDYKQRYYMIVDGHRLAWKVCPFSGSMVKMGTWNRVGSRFDTSQTINYSRIWGKCYVVV